MVVDLKMAEGILRMSISQRLRENETTAEIVFRDKPAMREELRLNNMSNYEYASKALDDLLAEVRRFWCKCGHDAFAHSNEQVGCRTCDCLEFEPEAS